MDSFGSFTAFVRPQEKALASCWGQSRVQAEQRTTDRQTETWFEDRRRAGGTGEYRVRRTLSLGVGTSRDQADQTTRSGFGCTAKVRRRLTTTLPSDLRVLDWYARSQRFQDPNLRFQDLPGYQMRTITTDPQRASPLVLTAERIASRRFSRQRQPEIFLNFPKELPLSDFGSLRDT
ncbi:hypothetical protein BO78DRAFT_424500 [Aspergillus sclerotiicarbonarius CBS 121057]|uniref:Uncharacterized protein n=1 Tax=Aspergillus sclerotiicarbonarius (strain CBS 121057 / IBT 28362) TaxID=1448318 RepID=A0A319DRV7_ASPSB|nr:hypothetical protein BO78DRAFT_424500 [Aspergillus sclerotiicarbonarius CBS 121057]